MRERCRRFAELPARSPDEPCNGRRANWALSHIHLQTRPRPFKGLPTPSGRPPLCRLPTLEPRWPPRMPPPVADRRPLVRLTGWAGTQHGGAPVLG